MCMDTTGGSNLYPLYFSVLLAFQLSLLSLSFHSLSHPPGHFRAMFSFLESHSQYQVSMNRCDGQAPWLHASAVSGLRLGANNYHSIIRRANHGQYLAREKTQPARW
ncbi:hypothetical protein QR685DRAFT_36125 [Neurospora intermedia]|uniref:Questionable protein n=1 Tax=Neurospora intermedia TaxID=5142 RepID=A0ABR3DR39_NEUIN